MPLIDEPPGAAPDIYRGRFESCFREHYARLLAFAMRRVPGREVAEDVVADTFAVAWRRRDRIPDGPLPWLYAIAANVIADQYRSTLAANPVSAEELRKTIGEAELERAMRRAIAAGDAPTRPIPAGDWVAMDRDTGGGVGLAGVFSRHRSISIGFGLACVAGIAVLVVLVGGETPTPKRLQRRASHYRPWR